MLRHRQQQACLQEKRDQEAISKQSRLWVASVAKYIAESMERRITLKLL